MAAAKAYEELIDFIAAGSQPRDLIRFRPSDATRKRVSDLVAREKRSSLSSEEKSELDHYVELEHIVRLAKARARKYDFPK